MSQESLSAADLGFSNAEADQYAVMTLRSSAFNAVHDLWRKRSAEGMTKKDIARFLERDPAWVSRAFSGPANWEFKTFARLVRALRGEVRLTVIPLESPSDENFDAYQGVSASSENLPNTPKQEGPRVENFSLRPAYAS